MDKEKIEIILEKKYSSFCNSRCNVSLPGLIQMFNVLSTEDRPRCYKYMDYCYKIKNCELKKLINQIKN